MATPHIESRPEEIAKIVLMPGDPLRAKKIAEEYLEDAHLVNQVRNAFAYTGTYQGQKITVFSSGMGNPSMGIYAYELFHFYDVDCILRIGSAGSYTEELGLYDVLLVEETYSDSSFLKVQQDVSDKILSADLMCNQRIAEAATKLGMNLKKGRVYCGDVFYRMEEPFEQLYREKGCLACEMETFALFATAKLLGKRASCLLTISNSFVTNEETTSEERQNSFDQMIHLALEAAVRF